MGERLGRERVLSAAMMIVGAVLFLGVLLLTVGTRDAMRVFMVAAYREADGSLRVEPAARPTPGVPGYVGFCKGSYRKAEWFGMFTSERVTGAASVPASAGDADALLSEIEAASAAYLRTSYGVSERAIGAWGPTVWEVSALGIAWRVALGGGAVLLLVAGGVRSKRIARVAAGRCAFCEYRLTGEAICPECGRATG